MVETFFQRTVFDPLGGV